MFQQTSHVHQWFTCCCTWVCGTYIALWTLTFRDCRESTVVTKVFLVEYKQPNILVSVGDDDNNSLKGFATQVSFSNCKHFCEYKMLYVWYYLEIKPWLAIILVYFISSVCPSLLSPFCSIEIPRGHIIFFFFFFTGLLWPIQVKYFKIHL